MNDTSPTILSVEDTMENRILVRRILESQGYKVIDAVNALEGIKTAVEIKPDLILMDINLPDLDGFTAVTRIRSFPQLTTIPIIALTARNVMDDRDRAKAIGCDAYLNKPIDVEELITAVAKYLTTKHKPEAAATKREYYLQEQSLTLISELERKNADLEAANANLKAAYDRLKHFEEAKSNFISVASHELRTPLTVIHSYNQMLQMLPSINNDETAKELLAGVARGTARLKEIMDDMVSVIRMEMANKDFKFEPVSVRNIINTVEAAQAAVAASRQITLETDIARDLPIINGDMDQLHSALTRIVGNAIKYTPDGGRITISARLLAKTNGQDQAFVQIVVADTGVGIALDKQKLIFEKFSTAENVALHSTSKTQFMGGGAGLGLTIARGIIESHNGRIWVESSGYDPENLPGSKFFIILPAQ
ncbi:MAG: hybrid sensor histidine kinase/response regulator [Anaerolineae bacterium]|nr:hybrid sensor histidine kinase/response regulator [Anaerolineae bacterium]